MHWSKEGRGFCRLPGGWPVALQDLPLSPSPPRHSGVLSAYGMALADIVHEAQEPCSLVYEAASFAQLDLRMAALEETCVHALEAQGFSRWAGRAERAVALVPGAEEFN